MRKRKRKGKEDMLIKLGGDINKGNKVNVNIGRLTSSLSLSKPRKQNPIKIFIPGRLLCYLVFYALFSIHSG
jgi:hypothetical protein